ncbi:hypothetical protein HPP92_009810 [Vanilla planifolia]|uniref:Uncharacterized protein n=1 Tax=Vanilla planifolia TaxID=51239 RepID=A0A835RAS7_VANPL|nr:hypothetical protein HPP92_009810 [Vanilla planifolia]
MASLRFSGRYVENRKEIDGIKFAPLKTGTELSRVDDDAIAAKWRACYSRIANDNVWMPDSRNASFQILSSAVERNVNWKKNDFFFFTAVLRRSMLYFPAQVFCQFNSRWSTLFVLFAINAILETEVGVSRSAVSPVVSSVVRCKPAMLLLGDNSKKFWCSWGGFWDFVMY